MSWLQKTFASSIGGKFFVALTGLGLVGFVVAHLAGNLLIFAGPEALYTYAEGLRKFPALLWALRIGLILMAVIHVKLAISLNLRNKAARPVPYAKKAYQVSSWASRHMVLTGLLLLAFVLYHLADLTWRWTSAEVAALGPYDVYQMLIIRFQNPLNSLLYIVAMVLLGLHLSHGIASVFQTVGWNHTKYNKLLGGLGPALGWALALGFISIPVSVLFGIVK